MIEAKIALSSQPTAKLDCRFAADARRTRYQREISLEMFEQMIQPIIDRTVGPCKQALKDAGLKPEQIDEVVLVGGSTRIPKVRRLVQDLFGRVPHTDLNPDEVVALGAAVQANILGGGSEITKEMLLLDVTPLSLGIEVAGGVTDKIILRNSTIPASATQYYTTQVDGQTNVAIHVLQGERELARDCRSLARFDLKGVPPMPAGMPRIEVKFLIDANGILRVSAREQRSGKEAEIDVQPSYGLTDEQVENMLLESFDFAEEDFRQRQVIEARREADTILTALAKGKKSPAWQELTSDERSSVETLEEALLAVKKMADDSSRHPRSHRRAEPGHDASGGIDDGYRCLDRAQRQGHGRHRNLKKASKPDIPWPRQNLNKAGFKVARFQSFDVKPRKLRTLKL